MSVLEELLKKVPDSYPDFVLGMKSFLEDDGIEITEKMIKFMQDNPNATTSEIGEYHTSITDYPDIEFFDDSELVE
ncbi:MAG: hypothetical protein K6F71_16450 [Ruminococcus sp.]|uniref:Uncharacterized protein n=1 Tax=Ruminococcus albus TaxID=1264 RepID=A0A1I1R6A3_RUMAL|nr:MULTISPECIES: hypothetical protein [Ruminococcus]MCR5542398.1 hypothetical protein [Ruminococcus sp.]SFD27073.1 hypothetical protein SAMN02910406_03546 [Ruminococcus albus]